MKPFHADPFLDLAFTGRHRPRDLAAATVVILLVLAIGALIGGSIKVFIIDRLVSEDVESVTVLAFLAVSSAYAWLSLWLASKFVLKRPISTFMHATPRFDFSSVAAGASVYVILRICHAVGAYVLGIAVPRPPEAIVEPPRVVFVVCGLILVSVQSVLEEISVRGLLTQSIAVYVRSPPVLYTAVALLFASFHGWVGLPLFATFVTTSLLMSALCSMGRGIAMPIGFHVAYNAAELLGLGFFSNPFNGAGSNATATWCVATLHGIAAGIVFAATACRTPTRAALRSEAQCDEIVRP
ncbi:CPBP family intramembrane glutamic endopeptidase [Burkholderia pseudomultivorans]|uniref:CPBP family intramembrane glutamic endopeptidase n=1 Tax=Burkholderia pseudomultivorans TaxID=1207504 RepID=UPI00188F38B9|nr:CPBP family intramembrane glutamic endopeptidase [Burkholderia pseudomultivorans]MBF5012731.1 CPBP family intramembrane metalloprotease [Burkholderia pseudomultivorans]